ncbi:hypothetical protein MDMS009_2912 [Methylophaga thiooxydans DMS010]|uniref:Uncharacterized protein n=1 Tax=Methylophaga thiooxydans DMS010 TaxID=637616 RepID=C0N9I7_9GAMM|nr:hypothetical protein MDMS009_2912 [Methylophaga thiooxydans DMS010]
MATFNANAFPFFVICFTCQRQKYGHYQENKKNLKLGWAN